MGNLVFKSGFTLSELLIALAILGLIATFTIPKILQSTQNQSLRASLKEAIAAVSEIAYEGSLSGGFNESYNAPYLQERLAYVQVCPTDSSVEGCIASSYIGYPGPNDLNDPGGILASGAAISGLDNDPGDNDIDFIIDGNGPDQGPNQIGVDALIVSACNELGDNRTCSGSKFEFPTKYGGVSYGWGSDDFNGTAERQANKELYLSLFQ